MNEQPKDSLQEQVAKIQLAIKGMPRGASLADVPGLTVDDLRLLCVYALATQREAGEFLSRLKVADPSFDPTATS